MDLFLFTKSFPYGKGETFIESELPILASEFDTIHIFPIKPTKNIRSYPDNCVVHLVEFGPTQNLKSILFRNFWLILKIFCLDFFSNENRKALRRFKAYFFDLTRLIYEAEVLRNYLEPLRKGNSIFYTYWFLHWTALLSIVKNNEDSLISRSHGYDYNFNQNKKGFYPFRPFVFKQITKNYNVSNFGKQYLLSRYKKFKNKIECTYLGVANQDSLNSSDGETVVSCSGVIKLKRVHLIPEILREMDRPIHWVHFGNGPRLEEIKSLCETLPENIKVSFKGAVPNSEVLEWYRNNKVGAFIHCSRTEGLPVSMMEVQSFGIPILACDVGGVSEIVNDTTGKLIPKKFEISEARDKLNILLDMDNSQRAEIRENQRMNFSAEKNYKDFANLLKLAHD